jgi:hypothetical protein
MFNFEKFLFEKFNTDKRKYILDILNKESGMNIKLDSVIAPNTKRNDIGRVKELYRGGLGKDTILGAKEYLRVLFNNNGGNKKQINQEYPNVDELNIQLSQIWSKEYQSVEFVLPKKLILFDTEYNEGIRLVMVNRDVSAKGTRLNSPNKKDLTPNKILKNFGPFGTIESFSKEIYDYFKKNKSSVSDFCVYLTKNIELWETKIKIENSDIFFNEYDNLNIIIPLEDVIINNKKLSISNFKELFKDSRAINNISNDFGELLGGMLMFKIIKNVNVGLTYPSQSNQKLSDFIFDDYSYSSKSGAGASPSSTSFMQSIKDYYDQNIPNPSEEEKYLLDNFIVTIANLNKRQTIFDIAINLFNKFLNINHPKFNNWVTFINHFNIVKKYWNSNKNKISNNIIISNDFSNAKTEELKKEDIVDFFLIMYADLLINDKDNLFYNFIEQFLGNIRYNINQMSDIPKTLLNVRSNKKQIINIFNNHIDSDKKVDKTLSENLIGIILYFCSRTLIEVVNIKYKDLLDEMIKKSISFKQLYLLKIDDKNSKLEFEFKNSRAISFEFSGINSIPQWNNSNFKISMK